MLEKLTDTFSNIVRSISGKSKISEKNIEDAVAARKAGEKAIYGDFLKWYAETHPEQWEKLKK